ncbi:MAG: hypothetical protein M3429_02495 [Verrucomicrobiota bacterium]|nr:hypothetical protein [Verrucomicrobiota bacterium]
MRGLVAATIFLCLGPAVLAETETDAILARTSDYCVIGVSTGKRLIVRELVFGNAGWQQLRTDGGWPYPAGRRSIVYLSQNYDSIGASAERQIQDGQVEVENAADAGDFYRTNSNYTPSDLQTLPRDLSAYIRAVQQIATTARAERLARADRAFQAMLIPQLLDRTAEFERINRLANGIVLALHADDLPTLQRMTRIILSRPENIRESVRGEFAVAIASNYFRPGFDAIREVAFENSDTWSSEGAALTNLSRVGNTRDLERMRREAEAIIAAGQDRQVRYSLFWAMGELAARCYAEGSSKRAEWRKWFERMCARPTPQERKLDGPNLAASALHYIGNEETRALLESLQANDPAMRGAFSWAIRDIEARLKQQP